MDETTAQRPDGSGARSRPIEQGTARPEDVLEQALFEAKRVLVGQDLMIERLFVCWLAKGHCLLEGAPGLAKTLAAETVARILGGSFARLQFTPDLVPADLVGTRIYRPSQERFDIELGPIFANVVLADEINRAPAKVQSALLEVMAEHHVSIGGVTHDVPSPFIVLATQNPIESEGVYPLPEAQRDRFLMKVLVDYPSGAEEAAIVRRMSVDPPRARQVLTPDDMQRLQRAADEVFVHDAVLDYAVRLVLATREPDAHGLADIDAHIAHGASPRATLGLVSSSRALALMRGRTYVMPRDVYDVAPDVLRHRVLLSYEALAEGVTAEDVVAKVVGSVGMPRVTPTQDGPVFERASVAEAS
jgi:MoxR-like ATPase